MSTVQFKQILVGDLVAVQPDDSDQTSMIKLPDWQRNLRGTVVGAGKDAISVKVGDRVLFGAATGMESRYCGQLLRVMRDTDIDAVLS